MTSLSTALESMRNTMLAAQHRLTSSPTPPPGSTAGDGKPNTQLTSQTRSVEAKRAKALPPFTQREIEMAQAGQWNLTRFAEMISTSDILRQQLQAELDRLDFRMRPATENEIKACLAKMILHFPMTNMTELEKTLLLEDYIAELGRFPVDIIASVCREYCRNPQSEFFPKAGRLLAESVGKYSVLVKRKKTIIEALEQAKRMKERRLSDKELDAMMERVRGVQIPQPTQAEKIAATIEAMRKAGAPETDIEAFKAGARA